MANNIIFITPKHKKEIGISEELLNDIRALQGLDGDALIGEMLERIDDEMDAELAEQKEANDDKEQHEQQV